MKAVLKTCKHPHKVSKATPGIKILDILLGWPKTRNLVVEEGIENIDH